MDLQNHLEEVELWNLEAGQLNRDVNIRRFRWHTEKEYRQLALDILVEEVEELKQAVKDIDDVELMDAAADIMFTLFGLVAKSGMSGALEQVFSEVVASNLSKFQGEREQLPNGKLGKGSEYQPPQIKKILEDKGLLRR